MRILNTLALNVDQFLGSFEYMWKGMLCIFVVIGAIILSVGILNKISNRKSTKEKDENNN